MAKRKVYVRTPGGELKIRIERKKYDRPKCAICKKPLNMPKLTPKEARKGFRTPGRPYAGFIDHKCLELALKKAVRELAEAILLERKTHT